MNTVGVGGACVHISKSQIVGAHPMTEIESEKTIEFVETVCSGEILALIAVWIA